LGGGLVCEALAIPSACGFVVALFVVLSAFNFQAWDKYLLDVLPAPLAAIWARPAVAFAPAASRSSLGNALHASARATDGRARPCTKVALA
jgi:hypothetical protein